MATPDPVLEAQPRRHRCPHQVQFYEGEAYLCCSISRFASRALQRGDGVMLAITQAHWEVVRTQLEAAGLDVERAFKTDQLTLVSAYDTLAHLVQGDESVDGVFFNRVIGAHIDRVEAAWGRVRIFGEMVDVLWARGARTAALRLEQLWSDLGLVKTFSLLCSYGMDHFKYTHDADHLRQICDVHHVVWPAESYSAMAGANARRRMVVRLQQQVLGNATMARLSSQAAATGLWPGPLDAEVKPPRSEQHLGGLRVLLVDDLLDNREMIAAFLASEGAAVDLAENGAVALGLAAKSPYDVVLMDLDMPVLDGFAAASQLRQMGFALPIIAISGHGFNDERCRSFAAGCNSHLTKPVDAVALLGALRQVAQRVKHTSI